MSTVENRLNAKLKVWGMTQDGFTLVASLLGALPGISRSAAQRALSGAGLPFGAEAAIELDKLAHDIDAIIAVAHPLPLNLKNSVQVFEMVQAWRNGRLKITVVSE